METSHLIYNLLGLTFFHRFAQMDTSFSRSNRLDVRKKPLFTLQRDWQSSSYFWVVSEQHSFENVSGIVLRMKTLPHMFELLIKALDLCLKMFKFSQLTIALLALILTLNTFLSTETLP